MTLKFARLGAAGNEQPVVIAQDSQGEKYFSLTFLTKDLDGGFLASDGIARTREALDAGQLEEISAEGLDGVDHCFCLDLVGDDRVVQGAVGLHIADGSAGSAGDRVEGTDLVQDVVRQFCRGAVDGSRKRRWRWRRSGKWRRRRPWSSCRRTRRRRC